jgi:hypothetical protein
LGCLAVTKERHHHLSNVCECHQAEREEHEEEEELSSVFRKLAKVRGTRTLEHGSNLQVKTRITYLHP